MTEQVHDLAIYIGRFSPCHSGHISTINYASKVAKVVLVLIGSSGEARTMRNPWTYDERASMLHKSVSLPHFYTTPLYDWVYQDNKWKQQVQQIVDSFVTDYYQHHGVELTNIKLVGCDKDDTTYYLNEFPQWGCPLLLDKYGEVNATKVRNMLFNESVWHPGVPKKAREFLESGYQLSAEHEEMKHEYKFQQQHDESWRAAPYPVTFVTVDAIVIQSGHILLVTRAGYPGKGLWALPGGYLDVNQSLLDSAIRELREETGLKLAEKTLIVSCTKVHEYSNVNRSSRGRVITFAHLFELEDGKGLPRIKAGDDAASAKWIPLSEFDTMRSVMFEDHYHLVHHMMGM